jgi:hypothetical protein
MDVALTVPNVDIITAAAISIPPYPANTLSIISAATSFDVAISPIGST